jgi:hypothetical protein
MKIFQSHGSVLMEVADATIIDGRILITGKIMGALPMKAIVKPGEARKLIKQLGYIRLAKLCWLALFGKA